MKVILDWAEARTLADACRARSGLVVTTNGCFDLLHRGHVEYLQQARQLGDLLLVGLNTDESVRRLKGPQRPLNDQDARAVVMAALKCVDGVCLFGEETPLDWLRAVQPDFHVKGGDYDPEQMIEKSVVETWGGRIKVLPFVPGFSTSGLIEKSRANR
jgi:rfaE bifunctional protein nucleotidyltransferase chain/domain